MNIQHHHPDYPASENRIQQLRELSRACISELYQCGSSTRYRRLASTVHYTR